MHRLIAILIALALAAPARADDPPVLDPSVAARPGAVALYLQARRLADLGEAGKDPLLVLAAARILHGLELPADAPSPDAKSLLDLARHLDAGLNYSDLIDQLAREVPPQPRALRATAATLEPGQSAVVTLTFFGGAYGELAILGDGKSNLDLLVTAAGETDICNDKGSADAAFCGFALVENGDVTVTVTNSGPAPDQYLLLTE